MLIKKFEVSSFVQAITAGTLLFAISMVANAQKWEFQPEIFVAADYNDNPRLFVSDVPINEITGGRLDLRGRIVRTGPASLFRIEPRIRSTRYPDNRQEESDDLFLNIVAQRKAQSSNYGIAIQASREEVLRAELDDPNFDDPDVPDPVSTDSGFNTIANDRDKLFFAPYVNFQLSERTDLSLRASYIDIDYEREINGNIDYDTVSAAADFGFDIGERSVVGFTVFARHYESKNFVNDNDVIGALVSLKRDFSTTFRGSIDVGSSVIDRESLGQNGQIQTTSKTASVYKLNLTKSGELSRIVADVQKSVDPSGIGGLQERLQFRLRYIRSLSDKLTGTIEARRQEVENPREDGSFVDRDFARVRADLTRRLSRAWSISGSYTFTWQDFSGSSGTAKSNAVLLGFTYEPRRRP